jgi:hypothetical protein
MNLHTSKRPIAAASVTVALLVMVSPITGQEPWTRAAFEKLFPPPSLGWSISDMQVEESNPLAGPLEEMAKMAAAIAGKGPVAEIVRYRLMREYRSGARLIHVTIDSEDIMGEHVLQTLHGYQIDKDGKKAPLSADGKALRDKLLSAGLQPVTSRDHVGMRGTKDAESALVVLVGNHGSLALECAYANCLRDVDVLMKSVDLQTLDNFARFRHVKPK